jgi:hypothetical protein
MLGRGAALPALLAFAGCAVNVADHASSAAISFDAPERPIAGVYRLRIEGDEGLAVSARPLGSACTGIDVNGDFRARFAETANAALSTLFSGEPASEAYDVTLTPVVDGLRINVLRGGPMNGETRVSLGVGAEMTVRTPDGAQTVVTIPPDDTRSEAETMSVAWCDGGARGLDSAMTRSLELLFEDLRSSLAAASMDAGP